jgi:ring-1,2-phenylacetyl-CoA epoxidase subunit PaaD
VAELLTTTRPSVEQLWAWLGEVPDPEIPIVSIVDLGIVRDVAWSGEDCDLCMVTVTPTYSGCPATAVIGTKIREELEKHGVPRVQLEVRLSPAWTTDWLTPRALANLQEYGIAPPIGRASDSPAPGLPILGQGLHSLPNASPACPRCGSPRTTLISQFGSTPCKSLHRCDACLEPFDHFKCH